MGARDTMKTFFTAMNEAVVPTRGYGPKIISTPMGPFSWNDNLQTWVNTNNGMQMNNIAFQDMYAMMDYSSLGSGNNVFQSVGIYGSNRAGEILYEAYLGTESLEFITIGDSNIVFEYDTTSAKGYQGGWERTINSYIPPYGTPILMQQGCSAAGVLYNQHIEITNGLVNNYTTLSLPSGETSGIGNGHVYGLYTFAQGALKQVAGASFYSYLNYNFTNNSTKLVTVGKSYDVAYVPQGSTFTSPANLNYIRVEAGSSLREASGVTLQSRLVHGMFGNGTGQFKLTAFDFVTFNAITSPSYISTQSGDGNSYYYKTSTLDFWATGNTFPIYSSWDGINQGNPTRGPFAALWSNVIRKRKGAVVSNFQGYAGISTTNLATSIQNSGKLLESFLKEAAQRQRDAADVQGKVIIFIQSGINLPTETTTSWTTAADNITRAIMDAWSNIGENSNNISIIFTLTHPTTDANLPDSSNPWSTIRPAIAQAAKNWAIQNSVSRPVTFVDFAELFSAAEFANYYYPTGQAHLYGDGYVAIANKTFINLIARARNQTVSVAESPNKPATPNYTPTFTGKTSWDVLGTGQISVSGARMISSAVSDTPNYFDYTKASKPVFGGINSSISVSLSLATGIGVTGVSPDIFYVKNYGRIDEVNEIYTQPINITTGDTLIVGIQTNTADPVATGSVVITNASTGVVLDQVEYTIELPAGEA